MTTDQYYALGEMRRWYDRGRKQIFELSGHCGSGLMKVVNAFLSIEEFKPYEICYLSYDQKTVMQYAANRCHCYYLPAKIYKWYKWTNFDTIDFLNPFAKTESEWVRKPRTKLDASYKIMIVLDSLLLNKDAIEQLVGFGLPILLLRDPCLTPSVDSFCFGKNPTVSLEKLDNAAIRDPIVYFAMKVLSGTKLSPGSYDNVHVVRKRDLNLYNLKSSNMVITLSEDMSDDVNNLYRNRVKHYNETTRPGERVICMTDAYDYKMKNNEESRLKCYLRSGVVGYLTKCSYHAINTKYVPVEFTPDFWPDPFKDIIMDRSLMISPKRWRMQLEPDESILFRYAYALPVQLARISNWDRCTVISETPVEFMSKESRSLLYTAITRCNKRLTLCI